MYIAFIMVTTIGAPVRYAGENCDEDPFDNIGNSDDEVPSNLSHRLSTVPVQLC